MNDDVRKRLSAAIQAHDWADPANVRAVIDGLWFAWHDDGDETEARANQALLSGLAIAVLVDYAKLLEAGREDRQ